MSGTAVELNVSYSSSIQKLVYKTNWKNVQISLAPQYWNHAIEDKDCNSAASKVIETIKHIIQYHSVKINHSAKIVKLKLWA